MGFEKDPIAKMGDMAMQSAEKVTESAFDGAEVVQKALDKTAEKTYDVGVKGAETVFGGTIQGMLRFLGVKGK